MLEMRRQKLVTKEKMKKAYQRKLNDDKHLKFFEESINDDLENFFDNLQDRKNIKIESIPSFFTPKLTEEELKLVEEQNDHYLSSFLLHFARQNPDVDVEEMKKSDSTSKYIYTSNHYLLKIMSNHLSFEIDKIKII